MGIEEILPGAGLSIGFQQFQNNLSHVEIAHAVNRIRWNAFEAGLGYLIGEETPIGGTSTPSSSANLATRSKSFTTMVI